MGIDGNMLLGQLSLQAEKSIIKPIFEAPNQVDTQEQPKHVRAGSF